MNGEAVANAVAASAAAMDKKVSASSPAPDAKQSSETAAKSSVPNGQPAVSTGQSVVNQLIADCVVHTDAARTSTLLLCPSKEQGYVDKLLVSSPTLIMSGMALLLSIAAFRYNSRKDARARLQSIHDDFWLRKVLSPQTVEPLLKQLGELGSTLPPRPAVTYGGPEQTAALELVTQHIDKIKALSVSFASMAVVDKTLAKECVEALERIEDRLTVHKFQLDQHFAGNVPSPNVTEAWTAIMEEQTKVLTAVQHYQNNVLSQSRTGIVSRMLARMRTRPGGQPR